MELSKVWILFFPKRNFGVPTFVFNLYCNKNKAKLFHAMKIS